MKTIKFPYLIILIALLPLVQGCELAGDILETGVWIGVTIVLVIIFVVFWLFRKMRR